jgi:hypothetical protein
LAWRRTDCSWGKLNSISDFLQEIVRELCRSGADLILWSYCREDDSPMSRRDLTQPFLR